MKWVNTSRPELSGSKPMDLFDTFAGRKWVTELLINIEREN
jgi:hypothetical protein